jgi:hypothetical protein
VASFHLWDKDTLIRLAEEQTTRIAELVAERDAALEAWRKLLREQSNTCYTQTCQPPP